MFKFNGIKRLYKPLGKFLLETDLSGIDAIVSVPLSAGGLRTRGFNQSMLIAKVVSDNTGFPLVLSGLIKKTDTPPQIGLTAKERVSNLKGAFSASENISGKRLLVVDDVMTTGATVNECSKTLLRAGAKDVTVLALARARAV